MKYSCVFSHVSGILKGFRDQTVLFLINSLRFDLCMHAGEKTIVSIWEGGGELNPSSFPARMVPAAWMGLGEGLEVAQGTVAFIVPLFLRAENLPVPTRPCWPLSLCSINPEFNKITAVITVLFIWEAKSKIASDLYAQRCQAMSALPRSSEVLDEISKSKVPKWILLRIIASVSSAHMWYKVDSEQ